MSEAGRKEGAGRLSQQRHQGATGGWDAATLHAACVAREEEAWRWLYSWCLKRARLRLPAQAEDLAQEVCRRLMDGALERLESPESLYGYVATMLNNLVADWWRGEKNRRELAEAMVREESGPEEQAMAREGLRRLGRAVRSLPRFCREAMRVYLRYRLGLLAGYREMAAALGVSLGTLSSRLHRCLGALRRVPEFRELAGKEEPEP